MPVLTQHLAENIHQKTILTIFDKGTFSLNLSFINFILIFLIYTLRQLLVTFS